MKILIIPDVHGRSFWRYALEHNYEYDKIIFLGDYVDPYPSEGISYNDAYLQFLDIVNFVNSDKTRIIALCGNHDLHYIVNRNLGCSRYDKIHSDELHQIYEKVSLKVAYRLEGYFFTHAGVILPWIKNCNIKIKNLLEMSPKKSVNKLDMVSWHRGGCDLSGSCLWCDLMEFNYSDYSIGSYQIFGHTKLNENPLIKKDYACLDCQHCFELDTNTKKLKKC